MAVIDHDICLTLPFVAPYFTEQRYSLPVLLDSEFTLSDVFGVQAYPDVFVITPDRQLVYALYGYKASRDMVTLDKAILDCLAGHPPAPIDIAAEVCEP